MPYRLPLAVSHVPMCHGKSSTFVRSSVAHADLKHLARYSPHNPASLAQEVDGRPDSLFFQAESTFREECEPFMLNRQLVTLGLCKKKKRAKEAFVAAQLVCMRAG